MWDKESCENKIRMQGGQAGALNSSWKMLDSFLVMITQTLGTTEKLFCVHCV